MKVKSSEKDSNFLSIILPAYNEELRISKTLKELTNFLDQTEIIFEIIIVTDGCTDKTPEKVKSFSKIDGRVISLNFQYRLGKGGAIIEGLKRSKGDQVIYMDSDGSIPPYEINEMNILLSKYDYDVLLGSRWVQGSHILRRQTLIRLLASRIFNLMIRILFDLPYKDTQCGFKAFKSGVIPSIIKDIESKGYVFDIELIIICEKKGFKIKETPISWQDVPKSSAFKGVNLFLRSLEMFFSLLKLKKKAIRMKNS